jgi:hypothetical protein
MMRPKRSRDHLSKGSARGITTSSYRLRSSISPMCSVRKGRKGEAGVLLADAKARHLAKENVAALAKVEEKIALLRTDPLAGA